ncbi:IS6 family transposase [Rhodococcus erythropolis]|nr:IS6 family transposase [Rhodococcus erythropolis]MDV6278035.1 IS6 family transposase [Rhodococcus erythropolis]
MYKGYRFPWEVISHCVWLYHRFTLSLREIELLMAERGIEVSYETIRTWCTRFGPEYARRLRRRALRPGDKWHVDEVFVKIRGVRKYLWRAVDQHGNVLDILIQSRRDGRAATRFFRPPRHRMTATAHRTELAARFRVWDQVTGLTLAA